MKNHHVYRQSGDTRSAAKPNRATKLNFNDTLLAENEWSRFGAKLNPLNH